MAVRVQEADFDVGAELDRLTAGNRKIGGLAVFVGLVREMHVREGYHKDRVEALTLEHYPGMTEKALEEIEAEAKQALAARGDPDRPSPWPHGSRASASCWWPWASPHREAAFEACEFLVDWLKTKAPFWKLEETPAGEKWVGAHSRRRQGRRALGEEEGLAFVVLDDFRRPHLGLVGVATELAQATALAQQVPALVEFDADLLQAIALGIGEFALGVELPFFVHQVADVRQDRLIGRVLSHESVPPLSRGP